MNDAPNKTQIVRAGMERLSRDVGEGLAGLGFARSRSKFWTRRHPHHLDFIHLFRSGSSYGAPYNASVSVRVHLGIAVLDDEREPTWLNGPDSSDMALFHADRFHLRFNAATGSTYERCLEDVLRFATTRGEPWFSAWREPSALLDGERSPLDGEARAALARSLRGEASSERMALTLKRFGVAVAGARQKPPRAAEPAL